MKKTISYSLIAFVVSFVATLFLLGNTDQAHASVARTPHTVQTPKTQRAEIVNPVIHVSEVLIVSPKRTVRPLSTVKTKTPAIQEREPRLECGVWTDSAFGGQYKRCEWR